MRGVARRPEEFITHQREEKLKLESQLVHNQQEVLELQTENQDLKAKMAVEVGSVVSGKGSEAPELGWDHTHPIFNK